MTIRIISSSQSIVGWVKLNMPNRYTSSSRYFGPLLFTMKNIILKCCHHCSMVFHKRLSWSQKFPSVFFAKKPMKPEYSKVAENVNKCGLLIRYRWNEESVIRKCCSIIYFVKWIVIQLILNGCESYKNLLMDTLYE